MDLNYYQIIKESLNGQRSLDEKTFESAAVLDERLRRLKMAGEQFQAVSFSPDVDRMLRQKTNMVVC